MINTLKYCSVAFNYSDGFKDDSELSDCKTDIYSHYAFLY